MNYAMLALVFGIAHHVWVVSIRNRVAEYMAGHIPRMPKSWGYHIQNWIIRVFLPVAIVLSQGSGPESLGLRLPSLTVENFTYLILLTGILFFIEMIILWLAISIAKDAKAIGAVKSWSIEWNLGDTLIGPLRWTIPEECFLRGYLISQLEIIGMIPALLVSTFFTAIMHESRGKFWILLSIFAGLILGLAFIMTNSLLPPFLIHAIGNELFPRIQWPWLKRLMDKASN